MESIISTFHIDWKILIAQIVNFGVVAGALWFLALKPLTKTMLERTRTIEAGLEEAKLIAEQSKQSEQERSQILKDARTQAQTLITEAEARSATDRAQAIAKAKADVQKVVEDGKESLRQERESMLAGLQSHVADLVIAATTKLLGDAVSAPIDKKLADHAVALLENKTGRRPS